jgi:hypothetical protein
VIGAQDIPASTQRIAPQILFSFPHPPTKTPLTSLLLNHESVEALADFCFPNGVFSKLIDYDFSKSLYEQKPHVQTLVQDLLYRQINLRENMFLFTISSGCSEETQKDTPYLSDNYLNCYCVWFNDLQRDKNKLY